MVRMTGSWLWLPCNKIVGAAQIVEKGHGLHGFKMLQTELFLDHSALIEENLAAEVVPCFVSCLLSASMRWGVPILILQLEGGQGAGTSCREGKGKPSEVPLFALRIYDRNMANQTSQIELCIYKNMLEYTHTSIYAYMYRIYRSYIYIYIYIRKYMYYMYILYLEPLTLLKRRWLDKKAIIFGGWFTRPETKNCSLLAAITSSHERPARVTQRSARMRNRLYSKWS